MNDYDKSIMDFLIGWMIGLMMCYFTVVAIMLTTYSFELVEVFAYSVIPAVFIAPIFGVLFAIKIRSD